MNLEKLRKLATEQRRLRANKNKSKAKEDTERLPIISRPTEGNVTAQFITKENKSKK